MAAGVATFRKTDDLTKSQEAFMESWIKSGKALDAESKDDPMRSVERGLEILDQYIKVYHDEPSKVVMPEIKFNEELWPGIFFRGILDGILSDQDDISLVEDKTVSWLGDAWFQEKRNSYQVKWYLGVAKKLGLFELSKRKAPRGIINAIYIHKDKFRFERQPVSLMNREIDNSMVELKKWIDFITNSVKNGIYPEADYSVCKKYGGCDYFLLRGATGSIEDKIVESRFHVEMDDDHGMKF
jgi:hypothetical protein